MSKIKIVNKELVFPLISTKLQRKNHYVNESMVHPAKMPTYLVRWIIKKYSKEGDLILDPMAGIGTTLIEASRLNRNSIGVEYEKKFVDMIEKSKKMSLEFETGRNILFNIKRGSIKVIHGDARYLSHFLTGEMAMDQTGKPYFTSKYAVNNLPKICLIATSPPYHSTIIERGDSNSNKKGASIGKEKKLIAPDTYSANPGNIDNCKKLGDIDLITTSPPYGEGLGHKANSKAQEPGLVKMQEKYKHQFSDDNIASRPHGRIDQIITSPPYGHQGCVYSKVDPEIVDNNPNMIGRKRWKEEASQPYSDNPDNIGMKTGETYLEAMLKVYKECYKVLKPDGYMVLVTKNFVKNKTVQRLDIDTIKLCKHAGFKFVDHYYHRLNTESFWQILLRKRCDNIKFIKPEKMLEAGRDKIQFAGSTENDYFNVNTMMFNGKKLKVIPLCKKFNKVCRFEVGSQKNCKEYVNTYPKITHEDVLVFKK